MAEHEEQAAANELVTMSSGSAANTTGVANVVFTVTPYVPPGATGVFPAVGVLTDEEDKAEPPQADRAAVSHARSLIGQGKVNRDSGWEMSAADQNALLGDPPNWQKYGLWHLGRRAGANAESKAAYAYPYGKAGKVYRGALIAAKQRSAQQGHDTINAAATALLKLVDKNKDAELDQDGRLVLSIEEWWALACPQEAQVRETFLQAVQRSQDDVTPHENGGVLPFRISTADVDRSRDIVKVEGWRTANWERNPVVLFGHDYRSLPVAKGLEIRKSDALVATAEFPSRELYDFGNTVYALLREGYLNAASVGFAPMKYSRNEDRGGIDFEEQELLEFSVVPVPANPNALLIARSAGVDLQPLLRWAERVLDETHADERDAALKRVEQAVVALTTGVAEFRTTLEERLDEVESTVLGMAQEHQHGEELDIEVDDTNERHEPEGGGDAADHGDEVTDGGLRAAVKDAVQAQLMRVTGKLPDNPAALTNKGRTT
jgi:HK97 family phage prohead protease